MSCILGIDPGSRCTGYGFLTVDGEKLTCCASGVVNAGTGDFPNRLKQIFAQLSELTRHYRPSVMAIEQVFLARNAQSALKLGQARGAAIVAAAQYQIPVFEYSAKQIKQAVVGYGAADKQQMQLMIRYHLRLRHCPKTDEADALGVAWTHAQNSASGLNKLLSAAGSMKQSCRGRRTRGWRSYRPGNHHE